MTLLDLLESLWPYRQPRYRCTVPHEAIAKIARRWAERESR